MMLSTGPNSRISLVAVFSPMPGTPGMLSEASPMRPFRSGMSSGPKPYLAITCSRPNSSNSEMPFLVSSTLTLSDTSCSASLSPVTMSASKPAFSAWLATEPMMSSASQPGSSSTSRPKAAAASRTTGIWTRRASSMGLRVALYSSYCWCLKVGSGASKAHTTASGFSCSRSLTSMLQKPSTALVGVPSGRVSVTGRAW